jgi:hypothetical protein
VSLNELNGLVILKISTVRIPWDVEEYYLKRIKAGGDKGHVKFPNPQFGTFSDPLTVVDTKGRIILWYLPGLLSEGHEVRLKNFQRRRETKKIIEVHPKRNGQHWALAQEVNQISERSKCSKLANT